jgi:recombination protein U
MEKIVKYPDGSYKKFDKSNKHKDINISKSKLGQDFEKAINDSNTYYLQNKIAAIYKKPTPIQIVKVDYPARNKARITEAYYKTPSTTDYNGIYREKYIDFEAKSCQEDNFSFERIYEHQIRHLENITNLGGISFLIIEFSKRKEIYILNTPLLVEKYEDSLKGGRKSIPYSYFKEHGTLIEVSYKIPVNYLKAVDKIYFK